MNLRRPLLIGAVGTATLGLVPAGLAVASTHSASTTTIKFIGTALAQTSTKTTFQETGKDIRDGRLLGYHTLTCRAKSASAFRCGGAASFTRGMIYFKFPLSATATTFSGRVTGGTGAYSGATGIIRGKAISSTKEAITIVIR